MVQDFDKDIGFWIKNVPYVWVNGETIEECKRFYILDSIKFMSVFDENNFIVGGNVNSSNKTFSILPLRTNSCKIVRNCFLLHNFGNAKNNVRVEGNELSEKVSNSSNFDFIFNIVDPKTNYQQRIFCYTLIFSNPKYSSPFDVDIPILLKTMETTKKFHNIKEAAKLMNLDNKNVKRVHLEALSSCYNKLGNSNMSQTLTEIIKDVNPNYEIRDKGEFGWRYEYPESVVSAHILYNMVIKNRFEYNQNINRGNAMNKGRKSTNRVTQTYVIKCNSSLELSPTFIPKRVVYTKDSLFIAQKITRDKTTDIKKMLDEFYKKKVNQSIWSTNKNANASYYSWFLKFCTIKMPVYVDIGCGSGSDTVLISKELGASKILCADVADARVGDAKNLDFMAIKKGANLAIDESSVNVVTLFHTLHHMEDASSRLKDIKRILNKGGILIIKDHDTQTELDAENVTFEHFVYSIGEGEATVKDEDTYKDIMPMYYFSSTNVVNFLEMIGFKKLYCVTYKNPTKTYNAVFQKI
jgi:SAM-dependent methyltransferase